MKSVLHRSAAAAAILAAVHLAPGAHAQENWPTRPVRLIVPSSPGGGTDASARIITMKLSPRLGQQVVIEYRPGAAAMIGTEAGAAARVRAPLAADEEPEAPHRARAGAAGADRLRVGQLRLQFASDHGALPVHGEGHDERGVLQERQRRADRRARRAGPGDRGERAGAVAARAQGRLRAFGITSAERSGAAPDIPTIAGAGLPGYEGVQWFGILGPAGLPPEIVARLHRELVQVMQDEDVRKRFVMDGGDPAFSKSPEEFAAFVRSEVAKWAKVAKAAGIERQ